jgi:hypothetical protein
LSAIFKALGSIPSIGDKEREREREREREKEIL